MTVAKPPWLKRRLPTGEGYEQVRRHLKKSRLHTVCQEAKCPNIWECFARRKTSTFLIMGPNCSRSCGFCAVQSEQTSPLSPDEPDRVARAASDLGLDYVVVTSVTRDDLPDGGAQHFAKTIRKIRETLPDAKIEVLVPDFQGSESALQTVIAAKPDVLNHNIETVPRLYPAVRPQADYRQSLNLFRQAGRRDPKLPLKSGLMVGLGETVDEICKAFEDLFKAGCRMLTIGQYLQPSREHLSVVRYVPPGEFDRFKAVALEIGFSQAASGPFVRSSYHAGEMYSKGHRY